MPKDQNFSNNGVDWNIRLEDSGELSFKADGKNGDGNARMVIDHPIVPTDGAGVTIGGSGQNGFLRIKNHNDKQNVVCGYDGRFAVILQLGGGSVPGDISITDQSDRRTVHLDGNNALLDLGTEGHDGHFLIQDNLGRKAMDGQARQLDLFDGAETLRASLRGDSGRLELRNSAERVTAALSGNSSAVGNSGRLELFNNANKETAILDGGSGTLSLRNSANMLTAALHGDTGRLALFNGAKTLTVTLSGDSGEITCAALNETGAAPLERSIAPLMKALDKVLALRGVTYQRQQVTAPAAAVDGDAGQVGFVCEELEAVCPELVTTDAEGRKSVNYSRMTAVLVEAVKEQQQQIHKQAAALDAASRRISAIEAGLAAHDGTQRS